MPKTAQTAKATAAPLAKAGSKTTQVAQPAKASAAAASLAKAGSKTASKAIPPKTVAVKKIVNATPDPEFHEFKTSEIAIAVGVLIERSRTGEHVRDTWALEFRVKEPRSSTTFCIAEPYLITRRHWARVARGEEGVTLYQGIGDGAIDIRDDEFKFVASMNEGGGDIDFTKTIPTEMACPALMAALADADALGLRFYVDPDQESEDEDAEDAEDGEDVEEAEDADGAAEDADGAATDEGAVGTAEAAETDDAEESAETTEANAEDDTVTVHS